MTNENNFIFLSALRRLRGNGSEQLIQNELEQLAAEKEKISKQEKVPYLALITKPSLRRALVVSLVLQAAQQFSGIIAVGRFFAK